MASVSIRPDFSPSTRGLLPQQPAGFVSGASVGPASISKAPVGISPALSDFIEFQTMMASSKNLHLKDHSRVSVAKTSFLSGMLAAVLTAIPTTVSAINGQGDKLFLVPILGTLAAFHGALLGLLLNHNRD
ncbi:hypothetical protein [Vampirovibrio sp.]|uniref:hypothetical protein n=1 Tax=Vampirovibrio sp. TaxID=2717857 RepID=UPI0035939C71